MIEMGSQRKRFNIVISDIGRCNAILSKEDISSLLLSLSQYGITYFAIIHDKDMDINGIIKRSHLHLVVIFESIKRAKQVLNLLCDLFLTNTENIQILECLSLVGAIQYLTHKNNPEKYQYLFEDIYSNNFEMLNSLYSTKIVECNITPELLFDMIENHLSIKEIISHIGLKNYQTYRLIIKDLM